MGLRLSKQERIPYRLIRGRKGVSEAVHSSLSGIPLPEGRKEFVRFLCSLEKKETFYFATREYKASFRPLIL